MTVTFLAHSGFLVEWERFYTLFDFYKGDLPALNPDKPLLIFASHRHEDHFDPRIFTEVFVQHPNVHYYLSRDLNLTERRRSWLNITEEMFSHVTLLRPDEVFITEIADISLSIRTIKSTDIGCAFLLDAEGKLVYHAGDLNWWHWTSEGKAYCNSMASNFKRAMEKLRSAVESEAFDNGVAPELTAAMVPLDPRLGDGFGMGLDYLFQTVRIEKAFPMHMWDKFEWVDRYQKEHPQQAERVVRIYHDGQSFSI